MRQGLLATGATDDVMKASSTTRTLTATLSGLSVVIGMNPGSRYTSAANVVSSSLRGPAPLQMVLSPQTSTPSFLGSAGVDVEAGDADFDARVVVEAAPADLARTILDADTRAKLLALMPCTVTLDAEEVWLRTKWRLDNPAVAERLVRFVVQLVERVHAAPAELEAARQSAALAGGGYRGQVGQAVAAVRAVDARQIAELASARRQLVAYRFKKFSNIRWVLGAAVAIFFLLYLGWQSLR